MVDKKLLECFSIGMNNCDIICRYRMVTMYFFCLLLASLFSPVAKAQEAGNDQIDFSNFRPPPDGMRYFGVPSASTFRHWQLGVSIWASYANDPLLLTMGDRRVAPDAIEVDGEIGDAIVDHRFIGNIQLSLGVMNHFSLSMDMPLVFWQSGYQLSGLGDPQLGPSELVPSQHRRSSRTEA